MKIAAPWSISREKIVEITHSNVQHGLNENQVQKSRAMFGSNIIQEIKPKRLLQLIFESIQQPMMLLLIGVAILSWAFGKFIEAFTMLFVVVAYVIVECMNKFRADHVMVRLKNIAAPTTHVLREGQEYEIPTTDVAVGDVLILSEGSYIPADARLLTSVGLIVNEASLTGESFPITKNAQALVASNTPLAERINSIFSGTIVVSGQAKALVVAVGRESEFGRIAEEVQKAPKEKTILQESMTKLTNVLALFALFVSALIPVLGFIRGLNFQDMILTWLALTFLMIPGQPPIIITMALALAAFELARKKIIVKRLRGIEMMGQVTSVMSDKTGTITESMMKLETVYLADGAQKPHIAADIQEKIMLAIPAYSNDPTDKAVREALTIEVQQLQPYDAQGFSDKRPWRDMMYKKNENTLHALAGSPELLIANSLLTPDKKKELEHITKKEADASKRVVAYAWYEDTAHAFDELKDLQFVALAVIHDPVRPGVREALKTIAAAGVTTFIVTGDHPTTTKTIAAEIGMPGTIVTGTQLATMDDRQAAQALTNVRIFARTGPSQKLRLVQLLKDKGEIVAVIGDGINDAPALQAAHIGIAMGQIGTDLTKEVADLVLTDDSYVHIPDAIAIGRKALDNFRKGLIYYLSAKVILLIVFLLPLSMDTPFPFVPLQIIFIELLMDLASSTIFVSEAAEPDSMRKPMQTLQSFLTTSLIPVVLLNSIGLALGITFMYQKLYLTQGLVIAQTAAFITWLIGHIFLALNLKQDTLPLIRQGLFSNYSAVLWLIGVLCFSVLITSVPLLYPYFHTTKLPLTLWAQIIIIASLSTFWIELKKIIRQKWHETKHTL